MYIYLQAVEDIQNADMKDIDLYLDNHQDDLWMFTIDYQPSKREQACAIHVFMLTLKYNYINVDI